MAEPRFKPGDEVFCDGLAWGCGTVIEASNPYIMRVDFGRYGIRPLSVTDQWRLATEEDKRRPVDPVSEPEPLCRPEDVTLEHLESEVSDWEQFVCSIEAGFDCADEYTHALLNREFLHGLLNGFARHNPAVPDVLKARIAAADKGFIELTRELDSDVWGSGRTYDKSIFWYYYRWPVK